MNFRLALLLLFILSSGCGTNTPLTSLDPGIVRTTVTWTKVGGSTLANQHGVYGEIGTARSINIPGARAYPSSTSDSSGNFWFFGGQGYNAGASLGYLCDLWKYNGTEWTWMAGKETHNQTGDYGVLGVARAGSFPGGRAGATLWTDSGGALWVFGGFGYDSEGTQGYLNDLWKWDGTHWIWVSGSKIAVQSISVTSPGSRAYSGHWRDLTGVNWVFGGLGHDSNGSVGFLNDLWKF